MLRLRIIFDLPLDIPSLWTQEALLSSTVYVSAPMKNNERDFDWGEIITKPVYTSDNKHVGHVDGLEADQFIVKDKIIHAKYYRMDRELLETYQDGEVKLRINEQELKSKYEKDSPGYFSYGA